MCVLLHVFCRHRDRTFCLDATAESGRLGRLLNHSRLSPNCATKVVEISEAALARLLASPTAADVKPRLATALLQQRSASPVDTKYSPTSAIASAGQQHAVAKSESRSACRSPQRRERQSPKRESPSPNKSFSSVEAKAEAEADGVCVREDVKELLRKCPRAHPFAGSDLSLELHRTRLILVAKRDIKSGAIS